MRVLFFLKEENKCGFLLLTHKRNATNFKSYKKVIYSIIMESRICFFML